jgi:hypothetical protein
MRKRGDRKERKKGMESLGHRQRRVLDISIKKMPIHGVLSSLIDLLKWIDR